MIKHPFRRINKLSFNCSLILTQNFTCNFFSYLELVIGSQIKEVPQFLKRKKSCRLLSKFNENASK